MPVSSPRSQSPYVGDGIARMIGLSIPDKLGGDARHLAGCPGTCDRGSNHAI